MVMMMMMMIMMMMMMMIILIITVTIIALKGAIQDFLTIFPQRRELSPTRKL